MFSKKLKKNIYFQFLFVFFFLLNCAYAQEYEKTEIADFIMEHFLLSMLITILLIILAVGFIWANVFNNKLRKLNYALKEKEFKYRALVENVHIGIYRNTPYDGGKFEQANSFMAHMFGFDSIEELCSVKVSSLYQNPKDRDKFLEKIRKFGFVKDEELFLKRKDGKNIIVSVTASAYFDKNDNIDYLDGVIEDITERKKIQEQTKNLADDWARTFDAISDFLFIQDPDFVITHVNKALCDALHIKKEEVIGKKCFQVLQKVKNLGRGVLSKKPASIKGRIRKKSTTRKLGYRF